ncbi:hypothetical protein KR038_003278 [Drosophila bunnanda]|nr:hypothetical protein KR038_003278 [Drosophila bunnanda]
MKFLLILSCLVLYVALTCAQDRCAGRPRNQDCDGGRNEGVRRARNCNPDPNPVMWYYNRANRECVRMAYHGCLGNNNRYCTKDLCERRCRRRD